MSPRHRVWPCLVLLLAGCGFHPVYQTNAPQSAALASIFVDIIPDRPGQLLREALQAKLEGADSGKTKRFELSVSYQLQAQALGTQADNSTTRSRNVGLATWALHKVGEPAQNITSGKVRSVDGYNVIDEQFFYADLSNEATQRRLAEALADQIVLGLAVYFRQHPEKA